MFCRDRERHLFQRKSYLPTLLHTAIVSDDRPSCVWFSLAPSYAKFEAGLLLR